MLAQSLAYSEDEDAYSVCCDVLLLGADELAALLPESATDLYADIVKLAASLAKAVGSRAQVLCPGSSVVPMWPWNKAWYCVMRITTTCST